MPTPAIPRWIREYRTPSYTNIYQLCPDETRLYGTESLYGDWDGRLLLLAKDFAPSSLVRQRQASGDPRPYHHTDWELNPIGPGARTNRRLSELADSISCGKLYGSVLAGLLRDDGRVSGALPDLPLVEPHLQRILKFTLGQMPKLRSIACLGEDAWNVTTDALGCKAVSWRQHRESRLAVESGGLKIHALCHPSRCPGGMVQVRGDWESLRDSLAET